MAFRHPNQATFHDYFQARAEIATQAQLWEAGNVSKGAEPRLVHLMADRGDRWIE